MAGVAPFCSALSDWIAEYFKDNLTQVVVFVPTARVAAQVRARLSADFTGVLPAILPLKGSGELADLLLIEAPQVVLAAAVRLEMAKVLRKLAVQDDGGNEQVPAAQGERLWRRIEGLYRLLDRLALHGISVGDLRRTVPVQMVGLWEAQAETLLTVAAHMEGWLARRGEVLSGAAERMVLEQAAEVLADEACGWIPVVAGVLDGMPAALDLAKVAARRGAVIVPEFTGAPVTAGLAETWVAALEDGRVVRLPVGGDAAAQELVVENDWEEARAAAALVRKAVERGQQRVAVVSPSRSLLQRIEGELGRWGIVAQRSGCLDTTPVGRWALAANYGLRHGRPADWVEAMAGVTAPMDGWQAVMTAVTPLADEDGWLDAEDWRELLRLTLADAGAPVQPVSDGITLLGPLDARLMDFDTVIAAGAVEGVWPAPSHDAWLSEAHLRALGLPDATRKAELAGTELESLLAGGSRDTIVLRARMVEGREVVRSRFLSDMAPLDFDIVKAYGIDARDGEGLGVFRPEGELWPTRWSASFIETMLACPYKALGERMLRLLPLAPLVPEVDARVGGLLAHRWLEKVGKEFPVIIAETAAQAEKRLGELAEFELRHETPVVRAIWRAKFGKLIPALVAQWVADGRSVQAVEKRLAQPLGAVVVTAKLDRIEELGVRNQDLGTGGAVIVDFKTSTPPSWADVARGVRPQLAIEAWLLGREGGAISDVEYWQLRGYGPNPLKVTRPGKVSVADIVAPVGDGLAKLGRAYGTGAPFPAVPDMAGGGLLATGHCAHCDLAGVCRRKNGIGAV